MNTSFFGEMLQTISERGRALMDRARDRRGDAAARSHGLVELCEELLSGRGEASGVALAREIFTRYDELTTGPRIAFFEALATKFGVDRERIDTAVDAWVHQGTDEAATELHFASEPRRQELFRRNSFQDLNVLIGFFRRFGFGRSRSSCTSLSAHRNG